MTTKRNGEGEARREKQRSEHEEPVRTPQKKPPESVVIPTVNAGMGESDIFPPWNEDE